MGAGRDGGQGFLGRIDSGRGDVVLRAIDECPTIIGPRRRQFAEPRGRLSEASPFGDGTVRASHSLTVTMQLILPPG